MIKYCLTCSAVVCTSSTISWWTSSLVKLVGRKGFYVLDRSWFVVDYFLDMGYHNWMGSVVSTLGCVMR
jgi:hypothetical protein